MRLKGAKHYWSTGGTASKASSRTCTTAKTKTRSLIGRNGRRFAARSGGGWVQIRGCDVIIAHKAHSDVTIQLQIHVTVACYICTYAAMIIGYRRWPCPCSPQSIGCCAYSVLPWISARSSSCTHAPCPPTPATALPSSP